MDRRKVLYLDDHLTIVSGDFRLEFGQYLHCWIHIPTFGGIHVYPLLPLLNILSILQFLLAPSPCVSLISIMTHLSGQTGIFGSFSSDMFRLKIPLFQLRPMSPSSISSQRWTGHLAEVRRDIKTRHRATGDRRAPGDGPCKMRQGLAGLRLDHFHSAIHHLHVHHL